uniref:Uncharacterized protein n=1 Tax=Timema cristinae TaxID=61476 RepID=A0A7R9H3N5_TIMCR|nr:unnamed protein product [Timema cristinae]
METTCWGSCGRDSSWRQPVGGHAGGIVHGDDLLVAVKYHEITETVIVSFLYTPGIWLAWKHVTRIEAACRARCCTRDLAVQRLDTLILSPEHQQR